jgi:hypothetical protein
MPIDFGGGGKPSPFGNYANFRTFTKVWKTGTYREVITTVIRETGRFFTSMKFHNVPEVSKLLEHFTKCEPMFFDWVKDENLIMRARDVLIPDYVMEQKVCETKYGSVESLIVPRLLATRRLVTETQVRVALQHNGLTQAIVSAETYIDAMAALKEAKTSWRAEHLYGIGTLTRDDFKQEFEFYRKGGMELSLIEILRFFEETDKVRNFRRMIQTESVFRRQALDGIYQRGPMLVRNIALNIRREDGRTTAVEDWTYQRDVENTEYIQKDVELEQWLETREGPVPRYFIEDDDVLFNEISSMEATKGIALVTDDIALCRRIARELSRYVIRIPVEYYYRLTYFGEGLEGVKEHLGAHKQWELLEDTGSIASGEERYFRDGEMYPNGVPHSPIDYYGPWAFRPPAPAGESVNWDDVTAPPLNFPRKYAFDGTSTHGMGKMRRYLIRESPFTNA